MKKENSHDNWKNWEYEPKKQWKIGIDPGLHGAISCICEKEIVFYKMPLIQQPWSLSKKQMVCARKLFEILFPYCSDNQLNKEENIIIEAVNAMPKQGISSTWKFAGAFYTTIAVCHLLETNPVFIHPASWKRKMGFVGQNKDATRKAALKLYPYLKKELTPQRKVLTLKEAQGKADALFIAIAGGDSKQKTFKRGPNMTTT